MGAGVAGFEEQLVVASVSGLQHSQDENLRELLVLE
jgi:hypothetical protein